MSEQHNEKLRQDCPLLYRIGVPGSVGEGWFGLLYDLSVALEKELLSWPLLSMLDSYLQRGDYPFPTQIKEKYGTLRFYISHGSDKIWDLIDEAEAKSAKTCERCGKPGKLRHSGWVLALCDSCEEKDKLQRQT